MSFVMDIADIVDIRDCGHGIEKFVAEELTKGPAATENDRLRLECVDLVLQNWRKRADERGYAWRHFHPELAQNMMDFGALVARASRTPLAKQLSFDVDTEHPRIQEARQALAQAKHDVDFDWAYLPRVNKAPSPGLEPPDDATSPDDTPTIEGSPRLAPSGQASDTRSDRVPTLTTPTASEAPLDASRDIPLSLAVDQYIEKLKTKENGAQSLSEPILRFCVKLLDDPPLGALGLKELERLDAALPLIPGNKGFDAKQRADLFYKYSAAREAAQNHKHDLYVPISETTLKIRYRLQIVRFLDWAREFKKIDCPKYEFIATSNNLFVPQDRESLPDGNVMDIVKLPIFTGRSTENGYFKSGKYIVQDDVYWFFLLYLFTGMRPGEVSQLRISSFVATNEGQYLINLRTHDSSVGRVRRRDATQLKTNNAARIIVVPNFIFEIGLKDRIDSLRSCGEDTLFPHLAISVDKYGTKRRASKITKLFQQIKKHCNIDAADISLYSIRHAFADRLDDVVAERT